jgi:hypothetical protein
MRTLKLSSFVPAEPVLVFEYVTAFPPDGEIPWPALEQKYGRFLRREGDTFNFLEDIGGGIQWQCVFDPPRQREMRAVDSTWSDRIDSFEDMEGGTLWTITWQLKARGPAVLTQWLAFQLKVRRQVLANVIGPVVRHFRESGCTIGGVRLIDIAPPWG